MSRNLTYDEAVALLPEWEWIRVLVRQHGEYPVEYNWPHTKVLEALAKASAPPEKSWIEIAERGAQRRGFGLRIDLPGDTIDWAYFETRERSDG